MKTKLSLIIVALLSVATLQTACAQQRITTKNYNVSNFSAIETNIVGNIIFTQSGTTDVTAEGDEEMVNNLTVKVENNTLKLSKKKELKRFFGNRKARRLTVRVSSPNLNQLESDGVGNITLNGPVKTESLHIESDGVGNVTASQLNCQHLTINSEGVGNIRIKGSGGFVEYKSDGVGNIEAREFIAEDIVVKSSGVGSVKCYASKNIELYGTGVGSITYYGKPNIKSLNKSGVGSIKSGD